MNARVKEDQFSTWFVNTSWQQNWVVFNTYFHWWLRWWRICLQYKRPGFDPWVRKISWRREWQPTLVFLPGEFHGQRGLVGYSPWGCTELYTTDVTTNTFTCVCVCVFLPPGGEWKISSLFQLTPLAWEVRVLPTVLIGRGGTADQLLAQPHWNQTDKQFCGNLTTIRWIFPKLFSVPLRPFRLHL